MRYLRRCNISHLASLVSLWRTSSKHRNAKEEICPECRFFFPPHYNYNEPMTSSVSDLTQAMNL